MPIRLKSRRECPPNGFQHKEKTSGWFLQTWDFNLLVDETIKHRRANPQLKLSTIKSQVEDEIDTENAIRVLAIKGAEIYVVSGGGPVPKPILPRNLPNRLAAVVGAGKKLVSGAELLEEWLGSGGKPESENVANSRAMVCAQCPKNGSGGLLRYFTEAASERIRRTLEIKNDMSLSTPFDEKIGVCEACLCPLKLKVWAPLDLVKKHLTPEAWEDLDPTCWILNER
jgi:hypothetical protein